MTHNHQTAEIKKLHLEAVVLFAINNIPRVDAATLKQFLELVNAGGAFGSISHEQIVKKMDQVMKYIPGACGQSLLILMDLLEIAPPRKLAAPREDASFPLIIEAAPPVSLGREGFYVG